MWKNRYQYRYKTSNPNLIITAVCSFPNRIDTVEKAVEYYKVKEYQNDPLLLSIDSDYYFHNGRNFIPLYFEDDVPKLKKLQALNPVGKGFFWCIGYQNPNWKEIRNTGSGSYTSPKHKEYREWLEYWLDNFHTEYSGITDFLFTQSVKTWIYESSKNMSDDLKSRRFDVMENKRLVVMAGSTGERYTKKDQFLSYLEEMYKTDWYEFVFKAFR